MSQHIPGTWEVDTDSEGSSIEAWNAGRSIAVILEQETISLRDANAHLIAAAPDLLAALETIKEWMIDCCCNMQKPGLPSREAYNTAVKAISKAKGIPCS